MDDQVVKVDDKEVLDLLRRSRKRIVEEKADQKDHKESSLDNKDEDEDDMDIDDEENTEENVEISNESRTSSDTEEELSDDRPEFEREAELAKEYESENVVKRKYELLYKNKRTRSNKQDSALLKLRNARRRKIKGIKLSSYDDEYEDEDENEDNEDDERDDDEDEENEEETSDDYEDNISESKVYKQKLRYKHGSRKKKHLYDSSSDYLEDQDVRQKKISEIKNNTNQQSSLFDDDNQIKEKLLKKCEKILESINLKLMKSVYLTKDRIEFMLEHPKFTDYLCGSYVKVPITNPSTNNVTFLTCEVFDSHIDDNNECVLTLQRGGSKKEWKISSVSNQAFTNDDLIEWKAMIREFYSNNLDYIFSLPKILQKKAQFLSSFQYDDDDIALILENKQKKSINNNLSGKVLIEMRTNLQTQIKQMELQLRNINLNNDERKLKLKKIDELQKELEQVLNQIEKLKLQKEMIHPEKSLRITSSRYIGGIQDRGFKINNAEDLNNNNQISTNYSNNTDNMNSNLIYKLIFDPSYNQNFFSDKKESNSTHKNNNILEENNETHFGRRECRPSVLWETKRSKFNNKPIIDKYNSFEKTNQTSQSTDLIINEKMEVTGDDNQIYNFEIVTDHIISEFKEFKFKNDFNIICSNDNTSMIVPPITSSWDPNDCIINSYKDESIQLSFQEFLKVTANS